jgi:hypothetical protein
VNPGAESRLQRLYGLPLEEFTQARDEAARQIRAEDREAAEILAAARKPTRAAWAVNQLARIEPAGIRALLDSADRLREARAPETVREAMREQRDALEGLVRTVRERLDLSEAGVERVRETLQAATIDPEARELLERGRFTRERQAAAFVPGEIGAGGSRRAASRPATAQRGRTRRAAEQRLSAARARVDEASAELERAVAGAEEARAAVESAQARLARAEREEAQARARLDA